MVQWWHPTPIVNCQSHLEPRPCSSRDIILVLINVKMPLPVGNTSPVSGCPYKETPDGRCIILLQGTRGQALEKGVVHGPAFDIRHEHLDVYKLRLPQMTPSLLTSLGDYWDHDRFQFADEATGGGLETGLTVVVSCPLKPVYLDQAWAAISSWSTLREAKNISFEHCPCPRLSCSCWVLTSVTRRPVVTCHSHSHSPLPARALSPAPAILTWILGIPKQADKPP